MVKNGVVLKGIMVQPEENAGVCISPIIYMDTVEELENRGLEEDIMSENIMTYYWKDTGVNNKVVARSYQVSDGWIFDIGSRFDKIDSVSGLHAFFVQEHNYCRKKSELNNKVQQLKSKYKEIRIEQLSYR